MPFQRRSVLTVVLALMVSGCANNSQWTFTPDGGRHPAAQATSASPPLSPPSSPAPNAAGGIVLEAFDLGFSPSTFELPTGGTYPVTLRNTGAIAHDITFDDGTTLVVEAGETATGSVDIPVGGMGFICSIAGHADGGMVGRVAVTGGQAQGSLAPSASAAPDDHGGPPATTDVAANPDAPAPVRYDPAAPPLREGETHDIELVMTEREMTVAPGFVQRVWTFGDTVPGPVIRVKVGDLLRIHLVNPIENEMAHSIDFHASMVAWNDEMRSIAPGEELIYEYRANFAGIYMYHCGTAPALHHIANGMYGMIIVEPEGGLEPVDAEFALVQSEWYLGPQGQPVSLAKAAAAVPAPDFVVFNGVANQYADGPITVATGERVRVFVLNAGPSVDSSFHIVGTIFDQVVKEGVFLERGNEGNWASQAVDLSPAQGAIVEFELAEDGLYPIVTHAFNLVGRGALGLFQAGDGDPFN